MGIKRLAEAVSGWYMIQTNKECIHSSGQIVRGRELAVYKNVVQLVQCIYIARPNTYYHPWIDMILNILFPVIVLKREGGKLFPKRKKEVFER